MTVAVMQPYFLPYLGYFQLIKAVDKFVLFDDVNYINRGWVNRNNFLMNGQAFLVSVPLSGVSQNKKINEILLSDDPKWRGKLLKTIETCYRKTPHFNSAFPLLESVLLDASITGIASLNLRLIKEIVYYLKFETEIIPSSSEFNNVELKAEERILDICRQLKADVYINPIGGADLYNKSHFLKENIELKFLQLGEVVYSQKNSNGDFIPYLSTLDALMNIGKEDLNKLLMKFTLI